MVNPSVINRSRSAAQHTRKQHANLSRSTGLLRMPSLRPCHRSTTEKHEEIAPSHLTPEKRPIDAYRSISRQGGQCDWTTKWPRRLRRNVRLGSRLCENSDVQLACRTSISISSIWESIVLAASFGRRQLRKQFCASFVQARFHTAWSNVDLTAYPEDRSGMSGKCHEQTAPQRANISIRSSRRRERAVSVG